MDAETLDILRASVGGWPEERLGPIIAELEHYPQTGRFPERLFRELDDLGVLHLAYDEDGSFDVAALAEIVHAIARVDASVAVLVVEQNVAADLSCAGGRARPGGWIALPLYDHPIEWSRGPFAEASGPLTGIWTSVPALPMAREVILPIVRDGEGMLVAIDLEASSATARASEPITVLGFRGCPVADLLLDGLRVMPERVLLAGEELARRIPALWSRAECLVMAIRSGILDASCRTAVEYARERYQGGSRIVEHSLVRSMLADLCLANERLRDRWRTLAATATSRGELGIGVLADSLESARVAWERASDGIQVLGGYGYMEDFGQAKRFRDARQSEWLLGHPAVRRFAALEDVLVTI